MKFEYLLIFTLLFFVNSFSQSDTIQVKTFVGVTNYEIEPTSIKNIESPAITQFQGSYHFGESEDESSLEVLYSNGKLFARSVYNDWENNTWVNKIFREYIRPLKDSIQINKTIYKLYRCIKTQNTILKVGDMGLVSNSYETVGNIKYHYIQFNYRSEIIFKGRFPEASFVKLTEKDIKSLSKSDLKIMRNEIFARKGHEFKKGGQMSLYFNKLDWYNALEKQKQVNFDEIEEHNIDLIMKLEVK